MISVKDLHFSYNKETHAVRGVSFDIPDGQWVSILGHNGSGKSTLSKLLNGLIRPNKGTVTIDGEELNDDTVNNIRKKVGIVFQNPDNQFIGVTVKHDIAFGLENRRIERDKMLEIIDEYAKLVEMDKFLKMEPSRLSGGQKQRVAIAGVLAINPSIIIFDEATSMLDPEGVNEITSLIENLKGSKTIITITHDLNFASKSDRIIVMNKGKIVSDDTPDETFKKLDLLVNAKLDIPFNLKVYNDALKNDKINQKKELMNALWELSLKK
ncbi:MAG: energy-coupling factor transporter ATPase [Acholeplasmatales bacterium]|nr:energy-coupling factor transporter ATPase [Acholeplasmatales bacterium]